MTRHDSSFDYPLYRTDPNRRQFLRSTAVLAGAVAVPSIIAQGASACDVHSCDLRAKNGNNYISPVKDQGACNSCTAFGVVAAYEGSYHVQKRKPIGANPALDLKELDLFKNAAPGGCSLDHWWPRTALQYFENPGVEEEGSGTKFKIATKHQLIQGNPQANITAIKNWISDPDGGPVAAVMVEYEDFKPFGVDRLSGISDVYEPGWDACLRRPRLLGGHVMCIVGYVDSGNDKYWICKNSWYITSADLWNGDGFVKVKMKGDTLIDQIDVWGIKVPTGAK